MQIAFYAPLKAPGHPVPSGDRTMARLLIKALEAAGHEVQTVSTLRSFSQSPDMQAISAKAESEAKAIMDRWADKPADLWFSYHPYYKAPDLIGPIVANHYGLPVATAEASLSAKHETGIWRARHEQVRRFVSGAKINFCFTPRDARGLGACVDERRLVRLPPFIDAQAPVTRKTGRGGPARLITVAMMRGGVKLESYEMLAQALAVIAGHDWTLTIIGDGRERARVEKLFVQFEPGRITWTGEVSPGEVRSHLADGDIFVWPGIGEAYGLAYLEAQAAGLPVVALDTHGVPSAVEAKRTALLTPPGDIAAYGAAIARLAGDAALRRKMAAKAISFARDERNIAMAADVIDKAIRRIS